jgi:nucleotide-binding universal stress UspA family protein
MARLLIGTDDVTTSERLAEYLSGVVDENDTVFITNSLRGGEETGSSNISEGKEALSVIDNRLTETPTECHQFIRDNEPVEDLLQAAKDFDADEFVIGVRKRSPVGKIVFGSTARDLLLEANRPTRCVPLVSD